MGKPPSKASDGGHIDILVEWEDLTKGELQRGSGTQVLLSLKVRPETFPTGSPMSVWVIFLLRHSHVCNLFWIRRDFTEMGFVRLEILVESVIKFVESRYELESNRKEIWVANGSTTSSGMSIRIVFPACERLKQSYRGLF